MNGNTVIEAATALEDFVDEIEVVEPQEEEVEDVDLDEDELDEEEVVDPEEDEEDPEEESEEDEDEGEESEEESEEDTLFDIEIEGEEYEVNLVELKEGYLRNEELVRRTSELESQYQDKITAAETRELELAKELESLSLNQTVELQRYSNINWEALKRDDPEQYRTLRLEALDAQERVQRINQRRNAIQGLHNQAQAIRHEAYLKTQRELAQRIIPDFDKPEFQEAILKYGKEIGYAEDELQSISDARQLLVLNQARLYAESQVRRKAAVAKKASKDLPPAIKPGAPKTKTQQEGRQAKNLRSKLNQTHDMRDAAAVLMDYV